MKRSSIVLLAFAAWLTPAQAQTAGHCKDGETDYFSCQIKGTKKFLSICGSSDAVNNPSGNDAWLQYRFGRLNQLELVYPQSKAKSLTAFKAGHLTPIDNEGIRREILELYFDIGSVNYIITTQSGKRPFSGVEVFANGKLLKYRCVSFPQTTWSIDKPTPLTFYNLVLSLSK